MGTLLYVVGMLILMHVVSPKNLKQTMEDVLWEMWERRIDYMKHHISKGTWRPWRKWFW